MGDVQESIQHIEFIENETDLAFAELNNNSKNLIVSFASNRHTGFERKTSLLSLQSEYKDLDYMFLRDQHGWYLGNLGGIGESIPDTIEFFRNKFKNYHKVIMIGNSAGAFASLLYGSLLNVHGALAGMAQTNLEHTKNHLPKRHPGGESLRHFAERNPEIFDKYSKVANHLVESVNYYVWYRGNQFYIDDLRLDMNNYQHANSIILHGDHNYDNIKNVSSVNFVGRIPSEIENGLPTIRNLLK